MTEHENTPESAPTPEAVTPEAVTPPPAPTPADATPAPATPEIPAIPSLSRTSGPGKPPDGHWWWGTGRRKASVARVRVRPGTGKFQVNKREFDKYFTEERDCVDLMNVLKKTNTKGTVDVHVNVHGGGFTGQAGAIILGLGRALMTYDPGLEPVLRENNFLTRDPRKVERKKYGQPGARKRFQFSKR